MTSTEKLKEEIRRLDTIKQAQSYLKTSGKVDTYIGVVFKCLAELREMSEKQIRAINRDLPQSLQIEP